MYILTQNIRAFLFYIINNDGLLLLQSKIRLKNNRLILLDQYKFRHHRVLEY